MYGMCSMIIFIVERILYMVHLMYMNSDSHIFVCAYSLYSGKKHMGRAGL